MKAAVYPPVPLDPWGKRLIDLSALGKKFGFKVSRFQTYCDCVVYIGAYTEGGWWKTGKTYEIKDGDYSREVKTSGARDGDLVRYSSITFHIEPPADGSLGLTEEDILEHTVPVDFIGLCYK